MLLTGEGKLLYLSDSVSEHLGHSMVSLHGTDLFTIYYNIGTMNHISVLFPRWIWLHRGTVCTISSTHQIT